MVQRDISDKIDTTYRIDRVDTSEAGSFAITARPPAALGKRHQRISTDFVIQFGIMVPEVVTCYMQIVGGTAWHLSLPPLGPILLFKD